MEQQSQAYMNKLQACILSCETTHQLLQLYKLIQVFYRKFVYDDDSPSAVDPVYYDKYHNLCVAWGKAFRIKATENAKEEV